MKSKRLFAILGITAASMLVQISPAGSLGQEPSNWRQGVLTDIQVALDTAAKQDGRVVVCFSSDPVGDNAIPAQVFGAQEVRDWSKQQKVVPVLIEFPKARTSGVVEAKARFVELTRQHKIASSPTWLFLTARGQEVGQLCSEDVLTTNSKGEFVQQCDALTWLKQAAIVLKGGHPEALSEPANAEKTPTWYARFGGEGWTGRKTVRAEEGAMNYSVFFPPHLKQDKRYPLLVWLHGGVRSDGNEIADEDAVGQSIAAMRPGEEAIVLIPSAIAGQGWTRAPAVARGAEQITEPAPSMKLAAKLLDELPTRYPIDTEKVVLLGESGGAYGAWAMLEFYPDRFAGAVINSGGGDPTRIEKLVKHRIWVIHGEKDSRVPMAQGEGMFAALMKLRGEEPRVLTDGDWMKSADSADTVRFWRHAQSGHVPAFDYTAGIDWVLSTR